MSSSNLFPNKVKHHLPLIVMIVIFIAPIVLAKIYFANPYKFNLKTTAHGNLLKPLKSIDEKSIIYNLNNSTKTNIQSIQGKWSLIYIDDKECDADCLERKRLIHNLRHALADKKSKLNLIGTQKLYFSAEQDDTNFLPGTLLLVDSNAKAVMEYKPNQDLSSILKDLKKLFKYQW